MSDGAKVLSDISGISRGEVLSIWESVKQNHAALKACQRHRFDPASIRKLGAKHKCLNCGGEIGGGDVMYYIAGYKAAGGIVDDIWPGWDAS